jgi:DNA-binding transcriptional ArsR family regulator
MRALSHPVRIALIETLIMRGAMTATQVGERIGESPTTCSFHLRQLQKYGFVEEAGGGRGRSRPWRMTSVGFSFTSNNDDPETEIASSALLRLVRERQLGRHQAWTETRATYPRDWQDAAGDSELLIYCTPAELKQLNDELFAMLMRRFQDRLTDPSRRPPGALPVEMLLYSFPVDYPKPAPGPDGPSQGRAE